jgi:hypothetical protein
MDASALMDVVHMHASGKEHLVFPSEEEGIIIYRRASRKEGRAHQRSSACI